MTPALAIKTVRVVAVTILNVIKVMVIPGPFASAATDADTVTIFVATEKPAPSSNPAQAVAVLGIEAAVCQMAMLSKWERFGFG